jgi:hypothetical protein
MRAPTVFGEARYRSVDEARIVELLISDGWPPENAGACETAGRAARAALERCVALGLPYRLSPTGGRLFDPAETSNFLKWVRAHRAERMWEDRCVAAGRRRVWEPYPDGGDLSRAPDPETLGPQRYAMTIRRTFNLEERRPGERIRLRLPLPLEDAALGDLSFAFLPPPGADVKTAVAPGRLEASLVVSEDRLASIGVRASFVASPVIPHAASPLAREEEALYTRPSEGLIKVNERVRALAAELAGADSDVLAVVRRFWGFMLDELAFGVIHYDVLDPADPLGWTLEHGWYDCRTGSALLVALCRARRIPARLVTGYRMCVAAPGFHTWVEAWADGRGWTPLDLSSWDLSAGGRDAGWRDGYFGRLDHRAVCERPPRLFGGLGTPRLPAAWHMLLNVAEPGGDVTFENVDSGALAYREHIEVERQSSITPSF